MAVGSVHEVLAGGKPASLVVRVENPDRAVDVLRAAGIEATRDGDHLTVNLAPEQAARVTQTLSGAGLYLSELRPQEISLEDVFLELTKDRPA